MLGLLRQIGGLGRAVKKKNKSTTLELLFFSGHFVISKEKDSVAASSLLKKQNVLLFGILEYGDNYLVKNCKNVFNIIASTISLSVTPLYTLINGDPTHMIHANDYHQHIWSIR